MLELLALNVCVCLAWSGVALLVWWVADEWIDRPVVKVLACSFQPLQLGADFALDRLSVALPLATPEFDHKGPGIPSGPPVRVSNRGAALPSP